MKPYTMEELDAMLEGSERDFAAGKCYTTKEAIKMCEMKAMHNNYLQNEKT